MMPRGGTERKNISKEMRRERETPENILLRESYLKMRMQSQKQMSGINLKAVRIVKSQSNVSGSSYMFSYEARKGSCTAST